MTRYMRFNTVGPLHSDPVIRQRGVGLNEITLFDDSPALQAGDADMDLDMDQYDLVQVLRAAKYLTGRLATWGDGDWDGAPGGGPGNPPLGDEFFDQLDVIGALNQSRCLTGPYADLSPCSDDQPFTGIVPEAIALDGVKDDEQSSLVYQPETGELAVAWSGNEQINSFS